MSKKKKTGWPWGGKLYVIEKQGPDYYGCYLYRFASLYNGTRGAWQNKVGAIDDGNKHGEILLALHKIKSPDGPKGASHERK